MIGLNLVSFRLILQDLVTEFIDSMTNLVKPFAIAVQVLVLIFAGIGSLAHAEDGDRLSRDQLVAVFLYRISQNIEWPYPSSKLPFHIHLVGTESGVFLELNKLTESLTLSDSTIITTTRGTGSYVPINTHLVYFEPDSSSLFRSTYRKWIGKPILLVTDGLVAEPLIMVNLFEKNKKLSFQLSQANIINQGLKVQPEMVLLGGAEVDIVKLYRDGQKQLKEQEERLERLSKSMNVLSFEKTELLNELSVQQDAVAIAEVRINEQKNVLVLLENDIKSKSAELVMRATKFEAQRIKFEDQERKLSEQEKEISKKEEQLASKNSDLDALQNAIAERNEFVGSLILSQKNQEEVLIDQERLIGDRSAILENQVSIIDAQLETINKQENSLKETGIALNNQRKTTLLVFLVLFLVVMLLVSLLVSNRQRKVINLKLQQQKKSLEINSIDLEQAKKIADSASEEKSRFLANMSHELRTPLNAILGLIQLMDMEGNLDEIQRKRLLTISKSGEYLLSIINNILDLSKIEAGRIELKASPVDLNDLINNVKETFSYRAQEKGIRFEVTSVDSNNSFLFVDGGKLTQILTNLIANAFKFTDQGQVSVCASLVKKGGDLNLTIDVEDTGRGISETEITSIFETFSQGAEANDGTPSSGLGLAISRSMLTIMGGQLCVDSELGRGSLFTLTLPVLRLEHVQKHMPEPASSQVGRFFDNLVAIKVLVVEDHSESRDALVGVLRATGFDVDEARNGQEAIDRFSIWKPSFIWMDIQMPKMNGIDAIKVIRTLPNGTGVKIGVLTADVFQKKESALVEFGCDDIVRKPFLATDVFNVMAQCLNLDYRTSESLAKSNQEDLLTQEKLIKNLHEDIRTRLSVAATSLNTNEFKNSLRMEKALDDELMEFLIDLAESFRFDKILMLLGAGNDENLAGAKK